MKRLAALVSTTLLCGACATPVLGPAQIDALHTRRYDAPVDAAFNATVNALIDMGYHIALTDAEGGILRAERRRDPSIAEHALWLTASTVLTLGNMMTLAPPDNFMMCLLVMPEPPHDRTIVRFEIFKNGRTMDEEDRLEELWLRIDRRLLTMGHASDSADAHGPADGRGRDTSVPIRDRP